MTSSKLPTHKSLRLLLFNQKNELLLMCADDPNTTEPDGTYNGRFWFPIGGQIESGESLLETAKRELFEETGISPNEATFGPIVWHGEFDLVLSGTLTHMMQKFMVVRTEKEILTLDHLTAAEKKVIQKTAWFSLDNIRNCPDVIYPVGIANHLPPIMAGHYPSTPIEIDLGKKPTQAGQTPK